MQAGLQYLVLALFEESSAAQRQRWDESAPRETSHGAAWDSLHEFWSETSGLIGNVLASAKTFL
jgi:hypothetical protein